MEQLRAERHFEGCCCLCWGSPQKPQLLPTSPGVLSAVQAEDEKVVPVLKKAGGREKRGRQQGEVAAQGHQRLCWSFGRVFSAKSEQESWGCCIPALGVLFRAGLRGRDTDPSVGAPCHIGYSMGSAGVQLQLSLSQSLSPPLLLLPPTLRKY